MIYCVIPRELEDELYDKMVEYYKDNPQRDGHRRPPRGRPTGAQGRADSAGSARSATAAARALPGTFPETDARPTARRLADSPHGDHGATFKNYIGGEWVDAASGETFESRSPATGEVIGVFPRSGAEDVDRAVEAAKAAYEEWRLVPAPRRGEILFRFAQLLADQQGRPRPT